MVGRVLERLPRCRALTSGSERLVCPKCRVRQELVWREYKKGLTQFDLSQTGSPYVTAMLGVILIRAPSVAEMM
jgi:hypothetical protein